MHHIDPFNFSGCNFKSCARRKDVYTLFEFSSRPNKSNNYTLKTFIALKTYTLKHIADYCWRYQFLSNLTH